MADVLVKNSVDSLASFLGADENINSVEYVVNFDNSTEIVLQNKGNVIVTNTDNYCAVNINEKIKLNPNSSIALKNLISFRAKSDFKPVTLEVITGLSKELHEYNTYADVKLLDLQKHTLCSCVKNVVLYGKNNVVYISTDNGRTISKTYTLPFSASTTYVSSGKICEENKNKMIVFCNTGEVVITTNGGDNWTVCDLSAFSSEASILPPFINGCVWVGNTILFAEYGTTSNRPYRIFKSTNNGTTWSVSLSKNNNSEIRHWHHMDFLRYSRKIIVTSGDENNNVRWFISSNFGTTWTEIEGVNNQVYSQRYRTCRIMEYAYNKIMWGSDAVSRIAEICIADLDDIVNTTEVITDLNKTIFGIHKNGQDIIALTSTESTDYQDNNATAYLSRDNGKSWKRIFEYQVTGSAGGFRGCVGVNDLGEFMCLATGCDTGNYRVCIIRPNRDC